MNARSDCRHTTPTTSTEGAALMTLSEFRVVPPPPVDSPGALRRQRMTDDVADLSGGSPNRSRVNRHSGVVGKRPGRCRCGPVQAGFPTLCPIRTQTTRRSKAKHTTRRDKGVYNRPTSGAETQSRCIFSVWASVPLSLVVQQTPASWHAIRALRQAVQRDGRSCPDAVAKD